MTIETTRLRLTPFNPRDLLALTESRQKFQETFGLPAADWFGDFFTSDEVSPLWLEQLRSATDADPWRFGFALIHRKHDSVIGTASFKGPPDEKGMVEIAYGIVPTYQGQGLATEAASALLDFAFANPAVKLIRAHTLPTNQPSIRVLEKSGFNRIGQVIDPEDGLVVQWERTRDSA
jgi:RimJ/RimL family protein N-acetyltransferase